MTLAPIVPPVAPTITGNGTSAQVIRGVYLYRGWFIGVFIDGFSDGYAEVQADGTWEYPIDWLSEGRYSVYVRALPPALSVYDESAPSAQVSMQVGSSGFVDGLYITDMLTNLSEQRITVRFRHNDGVDVVDVLSGDKMPLPGGVFAGDLLDDSAQLVARGALTVQRTRYSDEARTTVVATSRLADVPALSVQGFERTLVPASLFGSNGNTGAGSPVLLWSDRVSTAKLSFREVRYFNTRLRAVGFPCVGPVGSSSVSALPALAPHADPAGSGYPVVTYDTPSVEEHFAHAVLRVGQQWYIAAASSAFRLSGRPADASGHPQNIYANAGHWPLADVFSVAVHSGGGSDLLWNPAVVVPSNDNNPTVISVDTTTVLMSSQIADGQVTAIGVYIPNPFSGQRWAGYLFDKFTLDYVYLYGSSGVPVYQDDVYAVAVGADATGDARWGRTSFSRPLNQRPSYEYVGANWRVSVNGFSIYTAAGVISDGVVLSDGGLILPVTGAYMFMDESRVLKDAYTRGLRVTRDPRDTHDPVQMSVLNTRPDLIRIEGVDAYGVPSPTFLIPIGQVSGWSSVTLIDRTVSAARIRVYLAPTAIEIVKGCAFDVIINNGILVGFEQVGNDVPYAGGLTSGPLITSPRAPSLSSRDVSHVARVGVPFSYTVTTASGAVSYGVTPLLPDTTFDERSGTFTWVPSDSAFGSDSDASRPAYSVPFFVSAVGFVGVTYARLNVSVLPQYQPNVDGYATMSAVVAGDYSLYLLRTTATSAVQSPSGLLISAPWGYHGRVNANSSAKWAALYVTDAVTPSAGAGGSPLLGVRGLAVAWVPSAKEVRVYWSESGITATPAATYSVKAVARMYLTHDGTNLRVYVNELLAITLPLDLSPLGTTARFGVAAERDGSGGRVTFSVVGYNPRLPVIP